MRAVAVLVAVALVITLIGCQGSGTTLIGEGKVFDRASIGEGPSVRITFPNVRRNNVRTWPEAFANVFTSDIVPALFGTDPITGYVALAGKTAVDLMRSGADTVDDGIFDIDGLATNVKFGKVVVGADETTFDNVDITLDPAGWKPLSDVDAKTQ